jgi:hypothetical protein
MISCGAALGDRATVAVVVVGGEEVVVAGAAADAEAAWRLGAIDVLSFRKEKKKKKKKNGT